MVNVLNGTDQESNFDDSRQGTALFYELWVGRGAGVDEDEDQISAISFLCACRMITADRFHSPILN